MFQKWLKWLFYIFEICSNISHVILQDLNHVDKSFEEVDTFHVTIGGFFGC
jgi:hypothetical protein